MPSFWRDVFSLISPTHREAEISSAVLPKKQKLWIPHDIPRSSFLEQEAKSVYTI